MPDKPASCDPGPEPHVPRLAVNDTTIEKLADILANQPKGTLVLRDELAGWLSSMDRYSGGGDRPFWIESYGGRPYTVERMTRSRRVDRLLLGVTGGIQPDRLQTLLLKVDDDGLLARFIPFWPELAALRRPDRAPDDALAERAFARLQGLAMPANDDGSLRPWFVPFEEPARDLLQQFRVTARRWESDAAGLLLSFIGKTPGMAVRLALVLAALDWAVSEAAEFPYEISVVHFGRAAHFVEAYGIPMARRAYADASAASEARAAGALARMIVAERWRAFTTREVQRKNRAGLQDKREIDAALDVLVAAHWVVPAPEPTLTKPRRVYRVNPGVWGAA